MLFSFFFFVRSLFFFFFFFFQAEDGIRDLYVTGVQTCALPISRAPSSAGRGIRLTATEGCHDPRYSELSRFWELERGADCGTFGLRGYRATSDRKSVV